MARVVTRRRALLVAALLPFGAAATGPSDPFTPPASAAWAPAVAAAAPEPAASGLTGVRLGAMPAALIDGAWIRTGQPVRAAVLAAVRIDGALLRHPDGRSELVTLFPAAAGALSIAASAAPAESASVSMRIAQKRGHP